MNKDIQINIIDRNGKTHLVLVPVNMNLNLMEVCKLNNIGVEGTCGGMAMCSSCQCYIISHHNLPEKNEDEIAMLSESLYVKENSRLGCQLFIISELEGLEIEIAPN
jgi:2Fe-2S ferredoxin